MATKHSDHGRRTGGDVNRAGPVKGAVPCVGQAASPTSSGSKTQGEGARSGSGSPHTPSSVGAPTNPRSTAPAAQRATSSSSREPMSPTKSASSPGGKASPAPKATTAAKQPSQIISKQEAADIEMETYGQQENPKWSKWRRNRITDTIAHKVSHCQFVNGKSNEVPQSHLESIVGQKWGIDPVTLQQYVKRKSLEMEQEIEVRPCGLFIDPTKNWLAASPDGVVQYKLTKTKVGLVEVVRPYNHRNHTVTEACKDFCLENNGHLQLKKNHPYFTQMQCQMAVVGVLNADLVVCTDNDIAIVPVGFDADFWKETVKKLEDFYTRAVLPEIKRQNLALAQEEYPEKPTGAHT
ncbi:uncharacterized protein LOC116979477 [Amblyraja radiata]|uniref:uncharacterized protein LOC116979477 n=1 Tax=Amblyraja radiata TaxID=386614 RepID=UPI0014038E81|nr:uncharacterized protein LOC116979477 [Amblyraja radiata]